MSYINEKNKEMKIKIKILYQRKVMLQKGMEMICPMKVVLLVLLKQLTEVQL